MPRRAPWPTAGWTAALLLVSAALGAQAPPPPSFTESVDVQETQIEVLVTDGEGRPVPGLTREDFQVLEDGHPVEVTGVSRAAEEPLVLAVFFDDASLRGAARATAFAGLRRFLKSALKPGDRVLLVRWNGALEIHGDPTGDATVLESTLGQLEATGVNGGSALQERATIRGEIEQANPPDDEIGRELSRAQATTVLGSLRLYTQNRAAEARAEIAGLEQTLAVLSTLSNRKALLYVGGGIPLSPAADLFQAWRDKFGAFATALGDSPLDLNPGQGEASRLLAETVKRANASGITLHALALPESGSVSAGSQSAPLARDPEDAFRALRDLAAGTGGRVVTDVQNPAAFLNLTGGDLASAYLVSYAPPAAGKKGRHAIEVRARGGALQTRHRPERWDGDVLDPLLRQALAALWLPPAADANPLKAELVVEEQIPEEDGRLRVTALVVLPLANVYVEPQENFHAAHLTLAVAAKDARGSLSGLPRAEVPVEIANERLLSAPGQTAGYRFTLRLSPGDGVVVVALRDDLSGVASVVRSLVRAEKSGHE